MRFAKLALISAALIIFITVDLYSQAAQYRLGITYASSLRSNKEAFEFSIGSEKVVLSSANPLVYFNKRFGPGETYQIIQLSGPRACSIEADSRRGAFAVNDIVVTADCGNPPLSQFKLEISGVESGEVFEFNDDHGRGPAQIRFNTTMNWGAFPQGDDYAISQTSGPRKCSLKNNEGVVPGAAVTVTADCGRTSGTKPTSTPGPAGYPATDLVSRSSDDKSFGTFYDSNSVVIGGSGEDEGRFVAFVSSAPGLGISTGKNRQIIWRDRKTGDTKVVSVSPSGEEGDQMSFAPSISADGRSVAFESYAANLVPGDTNGVRDVFIWRESTGRVDRVSTGGGGLEGDSESMEPTVSGDGSFVAFSSNARNLVNDVKTISGVNVYLKDIRSGSIQLISLDENEKKGKGGSNPSISEDGSRIAFYSYFPLTSEDRDALWDIYVWDSGTKRLKRVSKTSAGLDKDQGQESASRVVIPSISGNGKYVAFSTTATNMTESDTNESQDVFVAEIDSGRVVRASSGLEGRQGDDDSPIGQGERIAISFDGSLVAFSTKSSNLGGNLLVRNIRTDDLRAISKDTGAGVGQPAISREGRFVAFGSLKTLDARFESSGIFVVYSALPD